MTYTPNQIEKKVSVFVRGQFPEFYEDLGPDFIQFVVSYFEWLEEQGKPVYWTRQMPEIRDVDQVPDAFMSHYRKQYLPGIRVSDTGDARTMVKHALDLYRARGTTRADDLFFRLAYGVGAETFFPGDFLMSTSEARWVRPTYLELAPSDVALTFEGKEIEGITSGARAFVERAVRYSGGFRVSTVLYISALDGDFQTGERINLVTNPVSVKDMPLILGSLTTLDVIDGGTGFAVGDELDLSGADGRRGEARVSAIGNKSGAAEFTLIDGGFGYTANSNVLVSTKVLKLSNLVSDGAANGWTAHRWATFNDTFVQDKATFDYTALGGNLVANLAMTGYFANGSAASDLQVIDWAPSNSTAGSIRFFVLNGNASGSATVRTSDNTVNASVASYSNSSATGRILSLPAQQTFVLSGVLGSFIPGEAITAGTFKVGEVLTFQNPGGGLSTLTANVTGRWVAGDKVTGPEGNGTVNSVTVELGLDTVSGTFELGPGRTQATNTHANITSLGIGSGASFSIRTLTDVEYANVNVDFLYDYANVFLGATDYGFPPVGAEDANTYLSAAGTWQNVGFGTVASIGNVAPGNGYSLAPLARIYEPLAYSLRRSESHVTLTNATASFVLGEYVTQTSSGAHGRIREVGNNFIRIRPTTITKTFTVSNATASTQVSGASSGANASVTEVSDVDWTQTPLDLQQEWEGLDAVVNSATTVGNGVVSSLEIVDSGLAYENDKLVTFSRDGEIIGTAKVNLGHEGLARGRWLDRKSLLSDELRIQDSSYWQQFSYEVRSAIDAERYRDALQSILHVAGTKSFTSYRRKTNQDQEINTLTSSRRMVYSQIYLTSGNAWSVPLALRSAPFTLTIEGWGAGGDGGGSNTTAVGGGGGGGEYASVNLVVSGTNSFSFQVGRYLDTWFGNTSLLYAHAGTNGTISVSNGIGGTGGSGGNGSILFNGGNGAHGFFDNLNGGGGGGSAGPLGNGNPGGITGVGGRGNGNTVAGVVRGAGTSSSEGGGGGGGADGTGSAGGSPGGGGSGDDSGSVVGGNGGAGQIRLTITV